MVRRWQALARDFRLFSHGRVAPRLRHRALDSALPDLVTLADKPAAINAIARGLRRASSAPDP